MSFIKDRDVRGALDVLTHEFASMEQTVSDLQDEISDLKEERDVLEAEVNTLKDKVKELEEALVDAHLTGDANESK